MSHKEYNIIGDVAGRFDELIELLSKMPEGCHTILVGDLMDRGPKSKQVIEWALANKDRVTCIYGNHDDMMARALDGNLQASQDWMWNGGMKTLESYDPDFDCLTANEVYARIPREHVEFLKANPRFIRDGELLVTHAPIPAGDDLARLAYYVTEHEFDFIWNREHPGYRAGVFQVFGHNSSFRKYESAGFNKDGKMEWFAVCIDDCRHRKLMGIHWPSKALYSVDYKEEV